VFYECVTCDFSYFVDLLQMKLYHYKDNQIYRHHATQNNKLYGLKITAQHKCNAA